MNEPNPILRQLGRVPWRESFAAMQAFNAARGPDTADEIWLLEHPPVYTLGLGSRPQHLRNPGAVPVEQSDRGGQVTWHGPGQLVAYLLLDLKRARLGVRELVTHIEQSVIELLREYGVEGARRPGAPGVYVGGAKIAALGLRVRRGACYHGVALNVDCDLAPFAAIDPCGFPGLAVTRLVDLGVNADCARAGNRLARLLLQRLYPAAAERAPRARRRTPAAGAPETAQADSHP